MKSMLALALAYAGLGSICFSMRRHYRQISTAKIGELPRAGLRILGWVLLTLSLCSCIWSWGTAIGSVAWFGVLTVTGLVLAVLLPYAPQTAAILTVVPLIVSIMFVAYQQI